MRIVLDGRVALACSLASGCAPPEEAEIDPSCTVERTLTLELGQGFTRFVDVHDGVEPDVFMGSSFQVGSSMHYYVSVRVGGVDLEHHDTLELELDDYAHGDCPDDGMPCDRSLRRTTQVLGGSGPPWTLEDGVVVEVGLPVLYYDQVTTQGLVRDPCGREAWAQHRW